MNTESPPELATASRLCLQGDELCIGTIEPANAGPPSCGAVSGIRRILEHGGLTEQGLEAAIAQAEDLLMPLLVARAGSGQLELAGQELADIFQLLDTEARGLVSIAKIEQLFNQLADHAAGTPQSWRQPVPAPQAALALLILRECMHHGGFGSARLASVPG